MTPLLFASAIATASALLALVVTWLVLRRARRLERFVEPGPRSSHAVPTPTGGGIGIMAGGTVAGLLMAFVFAWVAVPVLLAAILIGYVGYLDDRHPIAPRWRLAAQVILFGAVVAVLPFELLQTELGIALWESVLLVLLVLAGVLWINLFNFMDGIDGLAASEAIFILSGASLLAIAAAPDLVGNPVLWWMLGLAAAVLGFLPFNWPPARIFMGDAGSTFLGLMIGFFALLSIAFGWLDLTQWLILAALFVVDGTTTLAHRILRREPFWLPHRLHAYQHLQRRFGAHLPVTLLAIAINLVLLLPLAWLAGAYPDFAWLIVVACYGLLAVAALRAGAGRPEGPTATG